MAWNMVDTYFKRSANAQLLVSSSETRILIELFDKFPVIKGISLIKKIFWGSL